MTNVSGAHRQRQVMPPDLLAALKRERAHMLARVNNDARIIANERREQMMKGTR